MYSCTCIVNSGSDVNTMAGKVPGHSSVGIVLNVKMMTLEPVNDSVPSLSIIYCVADIAFQAINKIIAFTVHLHQSVIFDLVMQVNYCL